MNIRNIQGRRTKYFYTILFLDNYYPPTDSRPNAWEPQTKIYDITNTTNSSSVHWTSEIDPEDSSKTLYHLHVRHNLPLPITLEMWNDPEDPKQRRPIFYCPILQDDAEMMSVGGVVRESNTSITLEFGHGDEECGCAPLPKDGEVFRLAIRTLPLFNLTEHSVKLPSLPLDEKVGTQTGLAIVFRRNSMDALFDLITEFDETYWHSLEQGFDLQYLTKESCYKDCYFAGKFTDELQDVLDLIDVNKYNIKYSWENPRITQY